MSGIETRDPFGRPERETLWGWIAPVVVATIAGSVWPPSTRSETPPFDIPTRVRAYFEETKAELPPCIERQLNAIDGLTEQVKACDDELNLIATQNEDSRHSRCPVTSPQSPRDRGNKSGCAPKPIDPPTCVVYPILTLLYQALEGYVHR